MTFSRGFGGYLQRFALSVDIVDEPAFTAVKSLVFEYVKDQLDVEYFEVMFAQRGDNQTLKTLWCSKDHRQDNSKQVRQDDSFVDQTSYAYGECKRLWILPEDRTDALETTADYRDIWSNCEDLPQYRSPTDDFSARTSIAVPLKEGDTPIGVLYLESPTYLEMTTVAQKELELLASAVSMLYADRIRTKATTDTTQTAIRELQGILRDGDFPRLTKPKVFVAYPNGSDNKVIAVLKDVLKARTDRIEPVFWRDITEPGPITDTITREIRNSAFGVCYLSQQSEEGSELPYFDNANVLFEAGMMNALSGAKGWIVVREDAELTGRAPFDIQSLRHVTVGRDTDGEMNREALVADLEAVVDELLGAS